MKKPTTVPGGLVVAAEAIAVTVVTVVVADAIPVATAVTEETVVGTGVPVGANVTTEATEDSVAIGAGEEAIMAPEVMVAGGTRVGETVGTAWPDAAGGGIKATTRPATAKTGMARRLTMRRWGWTTNVTPSRCLKARSPHRTQQFGLGCQITTMDCMREDRALVQNQRVGTWLAQLRSLFTDRSAFVEDRSSFGTQSA